MQVQPRPAPGCGFEIIWVVLNFIGVIAGILLGGIAAAVLSILFRLILPAILYSVILLVLLGIASIISGAVIGSAQWFALRRQIAIAGKWIGATALGWAVGEVIVLLDYFALESAIQARIDTLPAFLLPVLVLGFAGAILGSAQWLVLRKHVSRAGAWILISVAAWILGSLGAIASFFVGSRLMGLDRPLSPTQFEIPAGVVELSILLLLFSLCVMFLIVPALTGIGLAWLLRRSSPQPQNA